MNIALVDDDRELLEKLRVLMIRQFAEVSDRLYNIDTFESAEEFFADWSAGKYGLIVLDIYMGDANGITAAERIRETDSDVRIAFCTSSNEFATETYGVNASDYLQKPITAEKVARLLQKANFEKIEKERAVQLPDGTYLRCRNIIYVEYCNHKLTFYLKYGEPYGIYCSFSKAESLLAPCGYFFSPTKGLIINFYEVAKITEDTFIMKEGSALPIARRKVKEAKALYKTFQFETLSREVEF